MVVYHENVSGSVTPRTLGPYEFIATPPQQLVLNAILDQCSVGGCISPGVRGLAEQTGVSRGLITDCLRTLALDGWITYDGRVIMLLRDPAGDEAPHESPPRTAGRGDRSGDRSVEEDVIDQVIDQSDDDQPSDRSPDRSPLLAAVHRIQKRWNESTPSDRSPDRSESDMVSKTLTTTSPVVVHESSTTGGSGGALAVDRSADRSHPAAQVMAELGADVAVVRDALQARPDWTPQQVRDRWAYDQRRIAASDGRLSEGVFYHALRCGQLAPQRQGHQLDPAAYAGVPGFKLGSDQAAAPAEDLRSRAERITPKDISGADFLFVMQRLAMHESDEQALEALATRHRLRGGP